MLSEFYKLISLTHHSQRGLHFPFIVLVPMEARICVPSKSKVLNTHESSINVCGTNKWNSECWYSLLQVTKEKLWFPGRVPSILQSLRRGMKQGFSTELELGLLRKSLLYLISTSFSWYASFFFASNPLSLSSSVSPSPSISAPFVYAINVTWSRIPLSAFCNTYLQI